MYCRPPFDPEATHVVHGRPLSVGGREYAPGEEFPTAEALETLPVGRVERLYEGRYIVRGPSATVEHAGGGWYRVVAGGDVLTPRCVRRGEAERIAATA